MARAAPPPRAGSVVGLAFATLAALHFGAVPYRAMTRLEEAVPHRLKPTTDGG